MEQEAWASILQLATVAFGVASVAVGLVTTWGLADQRTRRRVFLFVVLDVIALAMLLTPLVWPYLRAATLPSALIAPLAAVGAFIEAVRLHLTIVTFSESTGKGAIDVLRGAMYVAIASVVGAGLLTLRLGLQPPMGKLDFNLGDRARTEEVCIPRRSQGGGGATCHFTDTWHLKPGATINSRSSSQPRNPVIGLLIDEYQFDTRLENACDTARVRWSVSVNGRQYGAGELNRETTDGHAIVPAEPVGLVEVSATRLDETNCGADLVLEPPNYYL